MNFNNLSKFVWRKYGIKFMPAIPGSKEIYVLRSPLNGAYFALFSRILKENLGLSGTGHISVLDLKCGVFAETIKDLPGFSSAFRMRSPDWVGVILSKKNQAAIKNALDYAFKLAMNNEHTPIINQQYLVLPGQKADDHYRAQPIKARPQKQVQPSVPAAIKKMRAAYDYSILPVNGRAKNFYKQGQMMAAYQDHYQPSLPNAVVFHRYYPTYHDMTLVQLRTYFTWRTKLRQGHYQKTSLSYAYVYVYELLNNIGCSDPLIVFNQLSDFITHYAQKFAPEMLVYLRPWQQDYVLYYHLGKRQMKQVFAKEIKKDQLYHVLLHPQQSSSREIFAALAALGPYLKGCLAEKKRGTAFQELVAQVWQEIMMLKKSQGLSYFYRYLAHRNLLSRQLFKGAVFYWRQRTTADYQIDPERQYLFQNGHCYLSCLIANPRQRQSLNALLHEIDRLARQYFHLGHPLKPRKIEKVFLQAIQRGIRHYQAQQEQAKIKKVKINFADLGQIRADASATAESLLTDEEKDVAAPEPVMPAKTTALTAQAQEDSDDKSALGLAPAESFFLKALLTGKPYQPYLKKHHLMASILADQINEKLFDQIGDNVIEFDDRGQAQIVNDYRADLSQQFLKKKGS